LRVYFDETGSGEFNADALLFHGESSHAPVASDELVFKGKTYVVERHCFVYEDQGAVVGVTLLVRPAEGFFPLVV